MSPATVYRRQSMAQLYEKLSAQSDEDDMAWLAQFSPEEKSDDLYTPATAPSPYLSSVSSATTSSAGSSQVDSHVDGTSSSDESSSDDALDSESESNAELLPLTLDFDYTTYNTSPSIPLLFQPDGFTNTTDSPYIPPVDYTVPPQPTSVPLAGYYHPEQPTPVHGSSDVPLLLPPSLPITGSGTTRSRRNVSADQADRQGDTEDQAHAESDDDADDDDEYVPSPTFNSRKRHRSTRTTATIPGAPPAPAKRVAAITHTAKRSRCSPPSRNVQAIPGTVSTGPKTNPWACPHCKWVQRNHRTPDLKRHIRTHTRLERPAQWVCCGVPLKDAEWYTLPEGAEAYNWQGKMMIGGCGREFSRRDALKRHLDNDHITCIGDLSAFATSYD
ncbi:hypothetical protein EDC04DRAFT_2895420 [Pisolithus marmoratus]|nr:hypothetical protein EDC04DRAFT_2895420 [Pisolithus marmoratus]